MTPAQIAIEIAALTGVAGTCAYGATYGVRTQWLGRTEWRGSAGSRSVALTFDDGPAEDTEAILDVLAACGAPAAFFLIGRHVERHAAIARRIVTAGHEVGNHSYSHPNYLCRSAIQTYNELQRTQDAIANATGIRPIWARPPFGVRTPAYFRAARALGLRTVQWTVAGFDWKRPTAQSIAGNVLERACAGSIILLHDGDPAGRRNRRETVAAVPVIVEAIKGRGLTVTSLAALLDGDPVPATAREAIDA